MAGRVELLRELRDARGLEAPVVVHVLVQVRQQACGIRILSKPFSGNDAPDIPGVFILFRW